MYYIFICTQSARIIFEGENFMNTKKKTIITFLAVTFAAGLLAGFLIMGYIDRYLVLEKPPFAPPKWIFPIVWNILYALIALAGAMAYEAASFSDKKNVLILYGLQLFVNFLWPILFFRFGNVMLAFYDLLALWVLIIANMVLYSKINRYSLYIFVPYLVYIKVSLA